MEVSEGRYSNVALYLAHFMDRLPEDVGVEIVTEPTMTDWHSWVRSQLKKDNGWAACSAKTAIGIVREFVNWLAEERGIDDTPRNLRSRFVIPAEDAEPTPWKSEELRAVWRLANAKMRLFILLFLNCGMGAKDISDLRQSEIDWHARVIERYRSKMRHSSARIKVRYRLWDMTYDLLSRFNSDQDRVLLSEKGRPLSNGRNTCYVRDRFKKLRGLVQETLPSFKQNLYSLRGTAATLIRNRYGKDIAEAFLAHKIDKREMGTIHYFGTDHDRLAEGVAWLGTHIAGILNLDADSIPPAAAP